ncbi:MAG: hypothetical protein A3G34_10085 [Candidatus Lindowbacteria bacterium RIFCSPLOWO2_12_FULL_62_27]|nr:MAG: hypothetical protein A3G34_10085 [Candidatus Lindowbacteria bacterium RIFCSPLOWO2_12_FULL_62_27]
MVFAAHLAAPAVESGPAVGPPRPTAPPAARRGIPPVFEQASIPALAQKKIRPGPITVASLVEDSFAFKIDSVRYTSDNLTVSGLIAIPKSRKPPFPAVVICHGYYPPANYWQGLGTLDTIQALAAEGYLVFLPDYRGFPPSEGHATYPYPGEVMDVVQGVVSLSMHPKVDAKRIAVIGYSMGGGIALQAAEILGSQIKAFVDYYGQLGGFFLREDELALLLDQGVDFPMAEAIFKAKSPFHHLQRLSCPTLIFHGQNDRTVSISQSLMLRNELRRLAKPVDLVAFPEYGHAFGDSFRNRSFPQLLAFLKTQIGK